MLSGHNIKSCLLYPMVSITGAGFCAEFIATECTSERGILALLLETADLVGFGRS